MKLNLAEILPFATAIIANDKEKIKKAFEPKYQEAKPGVLKWFKEQSIDNKQFSILLTPDDGEILAIPVIVENINNQTILQASTFKIKNTERNFIKMNVDALIDFMQFIKDYKPC